LALSSTYLELASCLTVGLSPLLQDKSALFYDGHLFVPSIFVKVPSDCPCLNSLLCSDVYLRQCGLYHEHGPERSTHWCPGLEWHRDGTSKRNSPRLSAVWIFRGTKRAVYVQLDAFSTNITNISKRKCSLDVAFGMCTVCGAYQDSDLKLTDYLAFVYVYW